MSSASSSSSVGELSTLLQDAGQASKKQWWERYLKNEIEFYGTPMADIRSAVKKWITDQDPKATPEQLRCLAWDMFRQPIAEQKLAAILILQEHVLPEREMVAERDLPELVLLFDSGKIADWSTTDWLCVRVLGKLIEQDGESTATMISAWVHSGTTLWQRRAALVAFVQLGGHKGTHSHLILDTASVLVKDPERFAQTGVGWTLRSLSDSCPDDVFAFLKTNKEHISMEGLRMAAARLSDSQRKELGITGKRKRR